MGSGGCVSITRIWTRLAQRTASLYWGLTNLSMPQLRFLDTYFGYNQIKMHVLDQEHTTFVTMNDEQTLRETYWQKHWGLRWWHASQKQFGWPPCSRLGRDVMSFGLKKVGATYQLMMNKLFVKHIDINIEVYVDDMLVQSNLANHHVVDLAKMFEVFRRSSMRLNLAKFAFGGTSRVSFSTLWSTS